MNIKSKLFLGAGISVSIVVVLFSLVLVTSISLAERNRKLERLDNVRESVLELDIVVYDYLLHREERMEQQWYSKYSSLGDVIEKTVEEGELTSIGDDYAALGDLFSRVTANYTNRQELIQDGASQQTIDAATALEERLVAQLLIASHAVYTDASALAEQARSEAMEAQRLTANLTSVLMVILAITVITSSLLVARSISKPLDELTKGAEIIGKGELEHRVEVKSVDELGGLAHAFNEMAHTLRESYKSLEDENIERKRAENLVRAQRNLALALNVASGLDEGLHLCVEAALQVSGMDSGGIYLIDEASGALDLVFHIGLSPDFISGASRFEADSANTQLVMEGEPVYAHHQGLGTPVDEDRQREGLRAIAILPIRHKGRVIGCLNIASHTLDDVPGIARGALETIVAQIGDTITRLDAEHALRESERFLNRVIESSLNGIYIYDLDEQNNVYINPQYTQLTGHTLDSLHAMSDEEFLELFHPDDLQAVFDHMGEITQASPGQVFEIEYRFKTADGRWIWCLSKDAIFLRDDDGRVKQFIGTFLDITERVRAEEAEKKHNEELARLYRASEALISSDAPNPEHLAESIVEAVLKEFGKSNCSLFLIDDNSAKPSLNRIAVAGPYTDEVSKKELNLDGSGLVPKAIRTGQIINSPDALEDPDYTPSWEAARSELAIPLQVGEKVIGVIDVQSVEPRAFSEDDERLMSIFAKRVALTLENASLYQQTQERLRRISSLRNIDKAITGSFDLRLTLRVLLEEVTTQLWVDAADVLLFNPHLQTLGYAAGRGFQTSALQYTNLRLGEGYAGKAALERRMISVANVEDAEDSLKRAPLLPNENFVTYYGVPLIARGEVKGVLEIFHRTRLDPGSDWLEFLETLAGQAAIALDNASMFNDIQRSNIELVQAYDATLEGWVQALDMRDQETEDHTRRVTEVTIQLAQMMGVNEDKLVHVRRGALLHDIGKMSIPDGILRKPGKLTDDEWEIMRQHPVYAHRFLSEIDYLRPALDIPYCHHEKWDGTGYPRGLEGEQIPLTARIFAVVDVWDALNSDRPYRKAWPEEDVLAYIREQAGEHFDPRVVGAFLDILSEIA